MSAEATTSKPLEISRAYWKSRAPYLLGLVIVYVGVGWSFAVGYSSIPNTRWTVGLILGPLLATPLAVFHLLLQWLLRKGIRRWMTLRPLPEALTLNTPISILMCVWLIGAYRSTAPIPVFERFVTSPIPSSVRVVRHGGGKGNLSEGVSVGIWFEIAPSDLTRFIQSGGFASYEDHHGAEYWKAMFLGYAQLEVPLAEPYAIYFRESKPQGKEAPGRRTRSNPAPNELQESPARPGGEYLLCPIDGSAVFYLRLGR